MSEYRPGSVDPHEVLWLKADGKDDAQRLIAMAALGVCRALVAGALSPAYACHRLFGPALLARLDQLDAHPALRHAIHMATELEDVADLIPDKLASAISGCRSRPLEGPDGSRSSRSYWREVAGEDPVKIQLADLRRATDALFDHLERTGRSEIDLTEDFYWSIPEERLYLVYSPPPESELTMGQLSDDWSEVAKIASGQRAPIAYALVWLSSLLRFIGSKLVS